MRRLAPRGLGAALERALPRLRPATTLGRVQETWPAVAGGAIAAEAEPVSERGGTVTFDCRSSVWAQELQLLSGDLLARLNAALAPGEGPAPVTSLRFVAGGRQRRP
jgi:predicted nucleic acid-binding Zn ribbon protein